MSSNVCEAINNIEEIIVFNQKSEKYTFDDGILDAFCTNNKCETDGQKLSSGFIALLEYFKSGDDVDVSENEKLAEYEICNTITKCNESPNNEECAEHANKCVKLYQNLVKSGPTHYEHCNPYCHILSNLKDDYEKFRKKYNENKENKLPEFTMPNGIESCERLCKSDKQKSSVEEKITEEQKSVTPTENSLSDQRSTEVGGSQEESGLGIEGDMHESNSITLSSVTPTSINNGNKLPYIAVPFVLIPIILGISHKYLIHGRGKKVKKKKNAKKIINLCEEK
ncbi:Plasmodium variant antigen protein Cir/Yir/Bir, putative [Plasmodium chabaudi adami]|uniref:Plasmodium variant antigen protein Cir/Yir/Bir, putative n=1 Tax=Plasmodium chabaudi adami TaxID=5826 RepID=A0A1C6WEU2_PLACE|nr:Plasmodium variant antigen protein Cir/Yir/Bir, putative [Plasmodium chabaudi adami]